MQIQPIQKRPLQEVSQAIWDAIDIMETHFGAVLTHDRYRLLQNNPEIERYARFCGHFVFWC